MIWLALISEQEDETHIHYEGHDSVESAQSEIGEIYNRLRVDGKEPYPYYIYEADEPKYGYRAYALDDMDFNFYKEHTAEETQKIKDIEKKLEKAIESGDDAEIIAAVEGINK